MNIAERFWGKVEKADGCWPWTGFSDRYGYGHFYVGPDQARAKAHRVAYEFVVGPIPNGCEIDHLCRNTSCVNPAHLEAVTHRENSLRGFGPPAMNARKTHCLRGHPLEGDNLDKTGLAEGKRQCRTCRNLRARRITNRTRSAITGKAL